MQSPRVYFNNIGSICTDSLRHGNGLSALLLLTRAAKSSAAKSSASKTRSMESVFHGACFEADSAPTLSAPYTGQARPYPARMARTKSSPNPLQNTLHGKRALGALVRDLRRS